MRKPEALEFLSKSLIEATDVQDQDVVLQHEELLNNLSRLFAKPGTKKWKGVQIRAQLTRYLSFFWFGQNKKRYGTEIPTPGCPVLLEEFQEAFPIVLGIDFPTAGGTRT